MRDLHLSQPLASCHRVSFLVYETYHEWSVGERFVMRCHLSFNTPCLTPKRPRGNRKPLTHFQNLTTIILSPDNRNAYIKNQSHLLMIEANDIHTVQHLLSNKCCDDCCSTNVGTCHSTCWTSLNGIDPGSIPSNRRSTSIQQAVATFVAHQMLNRVSLA